MNFKQERINFIVHSPLVPVVNGIRSTATNLILELNKICDLHVILILGSNNLPNDETFLFLRENNVRFSEVVANAEKSAFFEKLKVLFPYHLKAEQNVAKKISLLCGNDNAIYFGTSFDPVAYPLAKELKAPFFFPADSITLFEKNKKVSGILRLITKKIKIYIASRIENRIHCSNFQKIFYVSSNDIECSQFYSNSGKSALCRIGVQKPSLFKSYKLGTNRNLIFTGVMNFGPNEDAALYIIDELLPYSKNTFNVKIVGMNPTSAIKQRANNNVIVTGAVADISELLITSDIFVSPLFSGAGAKNKVIQSLAVGLIVVGSTDSFSGFDSLPPGAYIADSVQEFVDVINSLLTLSPLELQSISDSAVDYICQNYLWSASAENLLKSLSE